MGAGPGVAEKRHHVEPDHQGPEAPGLLRLVHQAAAVVSESSLLWALLGVLTQILLP